MDRYFEAWGKHQAVLKGLKKDSIEIYVRQVRAFYSWLSSKDRSTEPEVVNQTDVEKWLEYLFYQGNSNRTRANKLGAVREFWRFLVYEGVAKRDITKNIPRPRIPRKLIQDFTKADVLKLFSQCDIFKAKGLRDICLLICMAFAGMRVSEITGLNLEDIHDDGTRIQFLIQGKQDKTRRVEIWAAPSVFIRQWFNFRIDCNAGADDPLFVSFRVGDKHTENRMNRKDLDRLVKYLCKKAEIRKVRTYPHMLRATHGADLRHVKGYDIVAISERLGHVNIATTNDYLPRRGRITKVYPSLREYWKEFEKLWTYGEAVDV